MAMKNKTRYAILGILTLSDCTGYDIKKYCDRIISHFWHENYGHIYPVLNRLVKEGAVLQVEMQEGSRRKVYRIADAGRKEFMDWLALAPETQPPRSEFLLKLSFSNNMPKEGVLRLLSEYRQTHADKLQKYREMEEYLTQKGADTILNGKSFCALAPLRYGVLSAEAAVRWCDEMTEALKD